MRPYRLGNYPFASNTRLNGVSAARRKRVNPPRVTTSRIFHSPACAPSARPTSCDRDAGVQTIVDAARISHGGKLKRDQVSAIRTAFWNSIDQHIEEARLLIRTESMKPVHQRKKIDVLNRREPA